MTGDCAPETCPVPGGFLLHQPSVAGNAVLIACFAVLVPITLFLGYRYRTPVFASTLATGLLLDVLGFVGRLMLHGNVADKTSFALFLLGTVLGPSCISAAVFLILPHVMSIYGERAHSVPPVHVGLFFTLFIIVAGAVQLVGAIQAAFGLGGEGNRSTNILVGGLGVQGVALLMFIATHFWFAVALSGGRSTLDQKHAAVYQAPRFKLLLMTMQIAAALLLGHTIYRLVESIDSLSGPLAQNEPATMVLNGALPLLAAIILTIFSPGATFGPAWASTSPRHSRARPRPLPLHAATAPYDRTKQRHSHYNPHLGRPQRGQSVPADIAVGKTASAGRPPVPPAKHSPLRESTITSQQAWRPAQPSPIAQSKVSPTFSQLSGRTGGDEKRESKRKSQVAKGRLVDSETLW